MKVLRTPARALRAGFTLIELLAVMLIIGILMAFLVPQIPAAIDRTNVTACKANLGAISQGLLEYKAKYEKLPTGSGVHFFGALIADRVWDASDANSKRMTCPGVEESYLTPSQDGIPREEWYVDDDQMDAGYSTYAGRNVKDNPIRTYPMKSSEAVVADDNDPEGNHRTTTVVLWGDSTVRELEVVDLIKEGVLDEEAQFIPVGAESPVEALQKLSIVD
ncbi:MAG: prepilin-type N-terminal cleavage/methylation domain-containing protein [bacterium]|nr:prepilin-type N-terminal cleavage/methylation domain-containing protein [bacterium]